MATWAYEGEEPPFPLFGVFSRGGKSADLYSPFARFFGVSPRNAERGLWKILNFLWRDEIPFFLDFEPAFQKVFMGVEHSA